MKCIAFLALSALALVAPACAHPTPIAFKQQNQPLILRCTLRPNGQNLYSSNYLGFPITIRAGTPAAVNMFSPQRADVSLNKVPYQLLPVSVPFNPDADLFLHKFFVNSSSELGIDKLEASRRRNIENGVAEIGMSKAEIYTALGPPNWVGFGIDATNFTLEQILENNRWEYRVADIMFPIWPLKHAYMFDQEKLTQIIQ
jgi:hypothetical protein